MPNARYSLASRSYTAATGTNVDPLYPTAHLGLLARPRRVSRSLSTSATAWVLDLGSGAPATEAFSCEGQNFGTLTVQGNATDSWGAPAFSEAYDVTGTDGVDGRRKRRLIPPTAFTYRYVRLVPTVPEAAYYELGLFAAWPVLSTLGKNPAVPYERKLEGEAERLPLGGGGEEVGTGPAQAVRLTFAANIPPGDTATLAQYQALARIPQDRVWLWDENVSDVTKVYHVRRVAAFTLTRDNSALERIGGIQLLEVA